MSEIDLSLLLSLLNTRYFGAMIVAVLSLCKCKTFVLLLEMSSILQVTSDKRFVTVNEPFYGSRNFDKIFFLELNSLDTLRCPSLKLAP